MKKKTKKPTLKRFLYRSIKQEQWCLFVVGIDGQERKRKVLEELDAALVAASL